MILTTHALVGAAIGKHISNLWIIMLIVLPLHFFLDTFRHGEYLGQDSKIREVLYKVVFDLFFGFFIITIYILIAHPPIQMIRTIFFSAIISILPDFVTFMHWKLHIPGLKNIYKFHQWVHKYKRGSKERIWNFRNAINDIIFSILAIIILLS